MGLFGKTEYRVKAGKAEKVRAWIKEMESEYRGDGFEIIYHPGPAWDSGYPGDISVGGFFDPLTAEIHVFYSEQDNPAYKAEELAHYVQCKKRGFLGKRDAEIGEMVKDELEREMIQIMKSHGFDEMR
jgi:hypothetical protein